MARVTYRIDGTQTYDTEGCVTVNAAVYRRVVNLVHERHLLLTGEEEFSAPSSKYEFSMHELLSRLPCIEADLILAVHDLVRFSEAERPLGYYDPRFEPQASMEAIHKQAEKLNKK